MAASTPLPGLPGRPLRRRETSAPVAQRYNFATEALMRLAILAGLRCPNCGQGVVFDGTRLRCDNGVDCAYAWRDPDAAESDIYCGLT